MQKENGITPLAVVESGLHEKPQKKCPQNLGALFIILYLHKINIMKKHLKILQYIKDEQVKTYAITHPNLTDEKELKAILQLHRVLNNLAKQQLYLTLSDVTLTQPIDQEQTELPYITN